jgi:hypothetical protein
MNGVNTTPIKTGSEGFRGRAGLLQTLLDTSPIAPALEPLMLPA